MIPPSKFVEIHHYYHSQQPRARKELAYKPKQGTYKRVFAYFSLRSGAFQPERHCRRRNMHVLSEVIVDNFHSPVCWSPRRMVVCIAVLDDHHHLPTPERDLSVAKGQESPAILIDVSGASFIMNYRLRRDASDDRHGRQTYRRHRCGFIVLTAVKRCIASVKVSRRIDRVYSTVLLSCC